MPPPASHTWWLLLLITRDARGNHGSGEASVLPTSSLLRGDSSVEPDNPFFHDGQPLFAAMPASLQQKLRQESCNHAWRRSQHRESELDHKCDLVVLPWLRTTPGSLLGAFSHMAVGLDSAYPAHAVGKWSFQLAGGGNEASDADNLRALTFSAELWTYLAHHNKQHDAQVNFPNVFSTSGELLVHGIHGATWEYFRTMMRRKDSEHATLNPSAAWRVMEKVCAGARAADFSNYMSCAHGLGHVFTWYVTDHKNTVTEAVRACEHALPDGRLVMSCADGFFHEFNRAMLFNDTSIGQPKCPSGVTAACDHPPNALAFTYTCLTHAHYPQCGGAPLSMLDHLGMTRSRINELYSPEGFCRMAEGDESSGAPMRYVLSDMARDTWSKVLEHCDDKKLYTDMRQRSGCLSVFSEFYGDRLGEHGAGAAHPHMAFDFTLPSSARRFEAGDGRGGAEETIAVPKLRVTELSGRTEVSGRTDIIMRMCESSTSSFWPYLYCVLGAPHISRSHFFYLGGDGNWSDVETFSSAMYPVRGWAHSADPWLPVYDGTQEREVLGNCTATWDADRFEPGATKQAAFLREICAERALAHGYYEAQLEDLSALATRYATFEPRDMEKLLDAKVREKREALAAGKLATTEVEGVAAAAALGGCGHSTMHTAAAKMDASAAKMEAPPTGNALTSVPKQRASAVQASSTLVASASHPAPAAAEHNDTRAVSRDVFFATFLALMFMGMIGMVAMIRSERQRQRQHQSFRAQKPPGGAHETNPLVGP